MKGRDVKGLILSAVMLTAGFGRAQVYQVSPNSELTAATEGWGKAKVEEAEVVDGEVLYTAARRSIRREAGFCGIMFGILGN